MLADIRPLEETCTEGGGATCVQADIKLELSDHVNKEVCRERRHKPALVAEDARAGRC